MLNGFTNPRIEGRFAGERMRAWDVEWGTARGDAVIENGYVDVANAVITRGDSEIRADGRFSLGYPRKDRGEELNARLRLVRRPLADLRIGSPASLTLSPSGRRLALLARADEPAIRFLDSRQWGR